MISKKSTSLAALAGMAGVAGLSFNTTAQADEAATTTETGSTFTPTLDPLEKPAGLSNDSSATTASTSPVTPTTTTSVADTKPSATTDKDVVVANTATPVETKVEVTDKSSDKTVTYTINLVNNNGTNVGTTTVSGNPGASIDVTNKIAELGFKVTEGNPKVTLGDENKTLQFTVEETKDGATATKIKNTVAFVDPYGKTVDNVSVSGVKVGQLVSLTGHVPDGYQLAPEQAGSFKLLDNGGTVTIRVTPSTKVTPESPKSTATVMDFLGKVDINKTMTPTQVWNKMVAQYVKESGISSSDANFKMPSVDSADYAKIQAAIDKAKSSTASIVTEHEEANSKNNNSAKESDKKSTSTSDKDEKADSKANNSNTKSTNGDTKTMTGDDNVVMDGVNNGNSSSPTTSDNGFATNTNTSGVSGFGNTDGDVLPQTGEDNRIMPSLVGLTLLTTSLTLLGVQKRRA